MKQLHELNHVHEKTESGADVFVLDKGEVIDSEGEAMIQALHSRAIGGFKHHLQVLEEKGADDFMSKFYVQYSHKSIGDCGTTTLFIENISMLVAKAIQDSKLYNGQEASTRYIDFSKQAIINPANSPEGEHLQEKQRSFYLSLLGPLEDHLKTVYPYEAGMDLPTYNNAIKTRIFDIARGFLPAGCATNAAWHTTLRHAADRIQTLRHHPLKEVQEIAATSLVAVLQAHPNSFTSKIKYPETEEYIEYAKDFYYHHDASVAEFAITQNNIDEAKFIQYKELFDKRPNKFTELPRFLDALGTITAEFQLDFGSFRDLQRQRSCYQRMPLLTTEIGFNKRYLDSLSSELADAAEQHLAEVEGALEDLELSKEESQYYVPMGYNVSCEIMGTLHSLVYIAELRAGGTVHPTLRPVAIKLANYLEGLGIKMFHDAREDVFDIKRGKQGIVAK